MDNKYADMSREELEQRLKRLEETKEVDRYTKSEAMKALAVVTEMPLEKQEISNGDTIRVCNHLSYSSMRANGFRHILDWIVKNSEKELPPVEDLKDIRAHHYRD